MDQAETIFDDEGVGRISSYSPMPRPGMNLRGRHVDLTEVPRVKSRRLLTCLELWPIEVL
jgi:hypothetical protein